MRKICKQKIRKRGLWDGSTWATLNTGTCFSVSSDDKLVLFLFPGIPTGDPAIVAFYDKRIYKKLRLKELSLSDPLYHGKKQHRNMTKSTTYMTIEGRLRSVRTVINIMHFFKPINFFTCTIWKLAFSKLTKITPLTFSPFYQYNVCHDVTYQ